MPSYKMVPGAILKAVEDASSVVAGATNEGGDRGPSTVDSKMSTTLNSIMPYVLSSSWYTRK
jgi:hypothetical protein